MDEISAPPLKEEEEEYLNLSSDPGEWVCRTLAILCVGGGGGWVLLDFEKAKGTKKKILHAEMKGPTCSWSCSNGRMDTAKQKLRVSNTRSLSH